MQVGPTYGFFGFESLLGVIAHIRSPRACRRGTPALARAVRQRRRARLRDIVDRFAPAWRPEAWRRRRTMKRPCR